MPAQVSDTARCGEGVPMAAARADRGGVRLCEDNSRRREGEVVRTATFPLLLYTDNVSLECRAIGMGGRADTIQLFQ